MVIHYIQHENGRRCYVLGKRLHHGMVGLIGTTIFLTQKKYRIAGLFSLMLAHDIRDFPFTDRRNH